MSKKNMGKWDGKENLLSSLLQQVCAATHLPGMSHYCYMFFWRSESLLGSPSWCCYYWGLLPPRRQVFPYDCRERGTRQVVCSTTKPWWGGVIGSLGASWDFLIHKLHTTFQIPLTLLPNTNPVAVLVATQGSGASPTAWRQGACYCWYWDLN